MSNHVYFTPSNIQVDSSPQLTNDFSQRSVLKIIEDECANFPELTKKYGDGQGSDASDKSGSGLPAHVMMHILSLSRAGTRIAAGFHPESISSDVGRNIEISLICPFTQYVDAHSQNVVFVKVWHPLFILLYRLPILDDLTKLIFRLQEIIDLIPNTCNQLEAPGYVIQLAPEIISKFSPEKRDYPALKSCAEIKWVLKITSDGF